MQDNFGLASVRRSVGLRAVLTLACIVLLSPAVTAVGLHAPPGDGSGGSPAHGGAPTPNLPRNAAVMDQSAYGLGSMTWNVIMLESSGAIDGNQENWTAGEIATIQTEINQAKTYWEGLTAGFHPNTRLTIDVHYENAGVPMATGYEPINRPSTDETLWINQVMNTLGYNNASAYNNVRNYNQARRVADNNHWATTIFVVDDTVDVNNDFTNGRFAYAYFGGPFTVLTQGNDGWGNSNFNMVLAHEMGHIFNALDEYPESGVRNTQRGGYLNGLTSNASLDGAGLPVVPPQPNALMLNNGNFGTGVPYAPHSSASHNFGHWDSDGDTIPDILDTPPTLTGNDVGSDPAGGDFVFSGNLFVNDLNNQNPLNIGFSNSLADMTINTIAGAAYSLDGGLPVPFNPTDGTHDDYSEGLGFTLLNLAAGAHNIIVGGVDSVGNPSNLLTFQFISQVPEPGALMLALFGMIGLANVRRGRLA